MHRDGTVLVVDDDPAFRALCRATLQEAGLTVVEADHGPHAIELALELRPALILLDWRMPGESGITVCRRLREEPSLAGVRILMITGLDDERDRALARRAGADGYIVKGTGTLVLAEHVRRLLAADAGAPEPRSR
jgi:DNA-binding response OmpR family regulator